MKFKKLIKKLSVGLAVAALTIGTVFSSFAAVDGSLDNELGKVLIEIENYASDSSYKSEYEAATNAWAGLNIQSDVQNFGITFNGVTHYFKDSDPTLDSNFNIALVSMQNSLNGFKLKNTDKNSTEYANSQLDQITNTLGIQANIVAAIDSLESITPLIERISGLIVVVTLLGMAVFTAFDIAYLVFPVAKASMDSAASSGNKSVSTTDKKTGEAKFRWVTDDAINAYKEYTDTGKNALICYLGKRVWSYAAVAIVVYILMSGNVVIIIKFVLNMLSSLFGMLGGLAVT